MAAQQVDSTWMWHPDFQEVANDTAGLFVHFRRFVDISTTEEIPRKLEIHITADTRYKLYVNQQLVSFGPVKGDASLWYYDTVDIAPFLQTGRNHVGVHVLRFFYSTCFATSFPRLPSGGLRIWPVDEDIKFGSEIKTSDLWETAIDQSTKLRIDEPEDDFLHIYEHTTATSIPLIWTPVQLSAYEVSTGQSAPWNLSSRLIPALKVQTISFAKVHVLQSSVSRRSWEDMLLGTSHSSDPLRSDSASDLSFPNGICLPAGTVHRVDLEVAVHSTAFVQLSFRRSRQGGDKITVTYAESYEDKPVLVPYLRHKEHRQDFSKNLYGPSDIYELQGTDGDQALGYHRQEDVKELIVPFHFRTFRFIRLDIQVKASDLVLEDIMIEQVNYPLDVVATVSTSSNEMIQPLWTTSIRTLKNCMHDCYEDCPFYEQLQYAMDTRSSILFTYYVSGDDRLARQAIMQLRNSFKAHLGLTASRAPDHGSQVIPHFSLFWIAMVYDHWMFFGDRAFVAPMVPIIDAILNYFDSRIHRDFDLVIAEERPGIWNYHDWADEWRPYGIPPAALETGVSTYTNNLYAYSLKNAATLLREIDRPSVAQEYLFRAESIVAAIKEHCFDGELFVDGLYDTARYTPTYSQHNQAWAVLSGAATGELAETIMRRSLDNTKRAFVPTSISMSFYVLRAMSAAGGNVYNEYFHRFWQPWQEQLSLGLTTWEEDSVSQRSDCHAWGSAPIYEFMAEVAGVRPMRKGWTAVTCKPRVDLYDDFAARVPLKMVSGEVSGLIDVSWSSVSGKDVEVSLRVILKDDRAGPIDIHLPAGHIKALRNNERLRFMVEREAKLHGDEWKL